MNKRFGIIGLNAILVTLALFRCPLSQLQAQALTGNLVGAVQDVAGGVIPGATISAVNNATGVKTENKANSQGEYVLEDLPPGTYALSVSMKGFATTNVNDVSVQLNVTSTANVTLQVQPLTQTIEVTTEAAAQIDTSTAQIQNTFTTRQAADLPNTTTGYGVLNLSLLDAGVASAGGIGAGEGPSVGGQRPRNNNFMVDGIDNNSKSVTGPVVYIPNESIAGFTVLQNQFQAAYGHSSGGQFNVDVKSGTNQYHGTIYEYLENRNLNALDQSLVNQGIYQNPRYDQSDLGANFGGPIKKNKLFFFSSFEYNPIGQAATVGSPTYAPTAAGYATLAGIPGVSQTNLNVLKTYAVAPSVTADGPIITIGNYSVPTGIIPIVGPSYTNSYYGVASGDYNISDKDQIHGRYIYNRSDSINTTANLPAFYTNVLLRYHLATLAEYHVFSPTLTNEFRFAYQRSNTSSPVGNQTFPGLSAFPNLQFNDLGLQVGPNPSFPQTNVNNLYQFVDAVTWVKGTHTIKAGSEFRDYISPQFFVQQVRGNYQYTTVANYLMDTTPDYYEGRAFGGSTYYGNELATYSYLQDTWRALPNLTVDLGVRYEYTTVPLGMQAQKLNALASVPGLINFKAPSADPYGIGPRVGLAWTPTKDGNTVIRTGFGMAYDVIFDNVGLNTVPPEFYTLVQPPPAATGNSFLAGGGLTGGVSSITSPATARAATSSYLPDQKLPYSLNYTLDIQHVFARNYTVDLGYVGTRGVHLIQQNLIDRVAPVTATTNIPTFFTAPSAGVLATLPLNVGQIRSLGSLAPAFKAAGFTNTITSFQPTGWSAYNGLDFTLKRRFSNGLQYQLAYTWSHDIDNSTSEFASTYLTPRRAQDFLDLTAEKASSALDHRHRLTYEVIYDLPFLKSSQNWLVKNLLGNWEFVPIYTYETGELFTAQSGVDSNLNGDSAPDRTIINPNGQSGVGSSVYGLTATGAVVKPTASASAVNSVVAWVAMNPNAQYIQAGPGGFANAGRNTLQTRPIDNIDFSVIKHITFRERYRFDLEAHVFNLFNHPQFITAALDNVVSVNTATPSTLHYVTVSNPLFNNASQSFGSQPRVLQIVARINF